MTDRLISPLGHSSDPRRLAIVSIMLAIIIEFLSGLILFGMNCIKGPGVLDLFLFSGLKEGRPLDEKADRARLEVDHACFSENILFQKTIILIL